MKKLLVLLATLLMLTSCDFLALLKPTEEETVIKETKDDNLKNENEQEEEDLTPSHIGIWEATEEGLNYELTLTENTFMIMITGGEFGDYGMSGDLSIVGSTMLLSTNSIYADFYNDGTCEWLSREEYAAIFDEYISAGNMTQAEADMYVEDAYSALEWSFSVDSEELTLHSEGDDGEIYTTIFTRNVII